MFNLIVKRYILYIYDNFCTNLFKILELFQTPTVFVYPFCSDLYNVMLYLFGEKEEQRGGGGGKKKERKSNFLHINTVKVIKVSVNLKIKCLPFKKKL